MPNSMSPKASRAVTHSVLSVLIFLLLSLYHQTVTFSFASAPQETNGQLEWWEDPPESTHQPQSLLRETKQTIFEKWKATLERVEGVHGEVDSDKLPAPSGDINSWAGAEAGNSVPLSSNSKEQTLALEFLKKTEQSTSYAKGGIGVTTKAWSLGQRRSEYRKKP